MREWQIGLIANQRPRGTGRAFDPLTFRMAEGDWHYFNEIRFRETFHGPMVHGTCEDCGTTIMVVQRTGRIGHGGLEEDIPPEHPRCSGCERKYHGV